MKCSGGLGVEYHSSLGVECPGSLLVWAEIPGSVLVWTEMPGIFLIYFLCVCVLKCLVVFGLG